jgi:tetraspanin-13/31
MIVSFILIGAAVKEKVSGVVTSAPIIGGITACGIFLLGVSILGLFGAMKHHQVWLFAYMVILFLIFIIQFSVSCAALGVSEETEKQIVIDGWTSVQKYDNSTIKLAETTFNCCGLRDNSTGFECQELNCWPNCQPCMEAIEDKVNSAFRYVGGLGLFFSLTELIGGVVACRYRNLVAPENSGISGTGGI